MATPTLQLVSNLPENWNTQALIVSNEKSMDALTADNIVGITGEGVRLILNNWNTYNMKNWVKNLVILPVPPESEIPVNYAATMKAQVDAIAALYDAMLEKPQSAPKLGMAIAALSKKPQDAPKFNASFADKLTWGMEKVEAFQGLTTEKVLGWISSGVNSQGK